MSPFISQLLAAIMNTIFALGSIPTVYTIERVGRRKVLMYSAVVLTICMVIFVAMIGLPHPTQATQWTAVAAIFVYNAVFGYGWIAVPWLYGPEVPLYAAFRPQDLLMSCLRLLPSAFATQVPLLAHSGSGYSHSLPSLLEALRCRMLAGRYGFGWRYLAFLPFSLSISCAPR